MWNVSTTEEFDAWFSELGEDEQAEVIAKVELLKPFGPQLARPRRHPERLKTRQHEGASRGHEIMRSAHRLRLRPAAHGNPAGWQRQIRCEPEALLPATNHEGRRTLRCAPG